MITNRQVEKELKHIFGIAAYQSPAGTTYYVGVSSTLPNALSCSNITEPSTSGTGYARQGVVANAENFELKTVSDGMSYVCNKAAITFPAAVEDWGSSSTPIKYVFISTSSERSTGTDTGLMYFAELSRSRVIQAGMTLSFEAGALQFRRANAGD